MKSLIKFNGTSGEKINSNHRSRNKTGDHSENPLTPVVFSGVIVPRYRDLQSIRQPDFKLVCPGGHEYPLVATDKCRRMLECCRWEEVKVVGLLNTATLTLIPQRVIPKGPKGQTKSILEQALWKGRKSLARIAENVNDLCVLPAAAFAAAGLMSGPE